MCGISGIVNLKQEPVQHPLIQNYNDIINHRGPDDDGFYFYRNIALGHRRLSILDLSIAGHQPMQFGEKYTIVYNGEVYNYLEIKQELVKAGYIFASGTDTEVILAAYDYWKEACVNKFNGMWSFAILDKERNILFCSRDRFGIKPFYYRVTNSYFSFASEIKQFTTLPDWDPVLNVAKAVDFISHGIFDHTESTLFTGVNQLRGGYNLVFQLADNTYKINKWYNINERIKQFEGSFQEAKEKFRALFQDAVRLRLRSDVKVGSCLSGGLDSTSIVSTVNNLLRQEDKHEIQETVTACAHDKKYDEQAFADVVIKSTGVKAHKIYPDLDQLFDSFDKLLWHQDEPFASSSVFAQWCVFEEACQQNLIVMLDGQGADETLAGYAPFHEAHLLDLFKSLNLTQLMEEVRALQNLKNYNLAKRWQFLAKLLLPKAIIERVASNPDKLLSKKARRIKNRYFTYSHDNIRGLSLDQLLTTNLPMLLHYEDRNSMAHSIESRVPFLDYQLVEFILSLPNNYKINKGQTKYILREALNAELPKAIKERHDKMGFITPETVWIKKHADSLRILLQQAAADLPFLLNQEKLINYFDELIKNNTDISIGSVFFRIIAFHKWMNLYKVRFESY